MKRASVLAVLLFVAIFSLGCEKKGPAEKFGEKVDDAVSDAAHKVEDAAEDAADKAEELCEDAKEAAGAKDTDC